MDDDRIEVTLKRESNKGLLILFLDFAALTMGIALMLHNEGLHMVFSILIGLAITIAFVNIARLPYIGRVFQVALGLIWGLIAYFAIDNMFHYSKDVGLMTGLRENDQIWWWTIVIVVDLIFIAIHISAFNKYLGTLNLGRKSKSQSLNNDNTSNEDEVILYSTFSEEDKAALQNELDRMNKAK